MKPYLIFIEGGNIPRRLHASIEVAQKEAKRLAAEFPSKKVFLLHMVKQYMADGEVVESIGSHSPKYPYHTTDDLIPGATRYPLDSAKQKKPVKAKNKPPTVVVIPKKVRKYELV